MSDRDYPQSITVNAAAKKVFVELLFAAEPVQAGEGERGHAGQVLGSDAPISRGCSLAPNVCTLNK
jgi:hypothetical protein